MDHVQDSPAAGEDFLVRRFAQFAPHHPAMAALMVAGCRRRGPGERKIVIEAASADSPALLLTINDDMPYLVDTVSLCVQRLGLRIGRTLHPVTQIGRDAGGAAVDGGGLMESVICMELLGEVDPAQLSAALDQALRVVQAAVRDETAVRRKICDLEETLPDAAWEAKALLAWLLDGRFFPFGLTVWERRLGAPPLAAQQYGLCRVVEPPTLSAVVEAALARDDEEEAPNNGGAVLAVTKLACQSVMARDELYDVVVVRHDGDDDGVRRAHVLVGLFDPALASVGGREIPVLRRKIIKAIELAGVAPLSHDEKHLRRIIEIMPREALFAAPADEIARQARAVLDREAAGLPQLLTAPLPLGDLWSALALIPKHRYRPDLDRAVADLLAAQTGGRALSTLAQVDEYGCARVHVRLLGGGPLDLAEAEAALTALLRTWSDELAELLAGGSTGRSFSPARYRDAFPPAYRDDFSPKAALIDIICIEQALRDGVLAQCEVGATASLTVYSPGEAASLSSALPIIDSMGLRSVSQAAYQVTPQGGRAVWIQRFELEPDNRLNAGANVRRNVAEAFARAWRGELECDALNGLTVSAALSWREVVLMRALARYLRQAESAVSMVHMARVLNRNGAFVRALVDLFHARFAPAAFGLTPDEALKRLDERQRDIADAEDDRVCDFFRLTALATLRTNYYRIDEAKGDDPCCLALKLDSKRLPFLPPPIPHVETWVYAPGIEGVHLRGGPVARGGLRWSDRPDDFRTEILGLMKAQRVKNAVIVPVGAKGGFVVRRPPAQGGRDALQTEATACYRAFIRALLDITDNLDGAGKVTAPPRVKALDGPDPYLVVAADKGTATFSDVANAVAGEYDFWLGDAFASGGSAGYDHKAMGITARGAWVAARRHFQEMGVDPNIQEVTAVGVGDMSGDVFGNGVLLSKSLRLVAAFDHRHIFIDPNPDAAVSWAERNRLFQLPRSSWADYDRTLLSPGGGVYERAAKSVALSEQARQALGTTEADLTPSALIRIILRAPVDLIWFGGVGCYVKATTESHADAGDKSCDALRVDAAELRAKVVGEGANLALTQRGRIEFARRGGRINTDAIDNSAGVDCSDHEVNIKILLDLALNAGTLAADEREPLLARMTDAVARLVLDDNHAQTRALSFMERQSVGALDDYMRLIRRLERETGLDRGIEGLPSDEALGERGVGGEGLSRPELAVLLAYAKMWVYRELLAGELPDSPAAEGTLEAYFPEELQSLVALHGAGHRLRREIVATCLTNRVVDHLGPLFVSKVMERSGASFSRVFGVILAARGSLDLDRLWADVGGAPNQMRLLEAVAGALERLTVRLLSNAETTAAAAALLGSGRQDFLPVLETLLPGPRRAAMAEARAAHAADGLAPYSADLLARLEEFARWPDIARAAATLKRPPAEVAPTYFQIGDACHLDLVRRAAEGVRARTQWHRLAAAALIDDTDDLQARIAEAVIRDQGTGELRLWLQSRAAVLSEIDRTVGEVAAGRDPDLAALIVVGRQIRGGLCR